MWEKDNIPSDSDNAGAGVCSQNLASLPRRAEHPFSCQTLPVKAVNIGKITQGAKLLLLFLTEAIINNKSEGCIRQSSTSVF